MESKHTIEGVAGQLHRKLREYLETQYPISNPELQQKRTMLLNSPGVISTEPFVEATPVYEQGHTYAEMTLPDASKKLMTKLAALKPSIGVYPKPYVHQQIALESFFHHQHDLIVATGTGSGKTETFMYPILNNLYLEAVDRPEQFGKRAVRAMVLYPMNALVNDQMTRLRRLFRDERVKEMFREAGGRNVQFGMYTSRTPFPGTLSGNKKVAQLKKMIGDYLDLEENHPDVVKQMEERGKWMAKDLLAFHASLENIGKTGAIAVNPDDAELLTRHEMHRVAPDILVTNYSMLEYMLLRPIERSIWRMTREWLDADERNTFLLILDEAHMYRGTSGAEVAYLIRRLQSRLGIPRDRMRCILTSASIGSKDKNEEETKAIQFAERLTGKPSKRSFKFIKGVLESRKPARPAAPVEIEALNALDSEKFLEYANAYDTFLESFRVTRTKLNWPEPPTDSRELPEYLYHQLDGFGPFELLLQLTSGHATSIREIAAKLCPNGDPEEAEKAASHLLMMASTANKNGRPLLAARVHMFFRGVSGIYICLNPNCSAQSARDHQTRFGKMYDSYTLACECGSRVYEVVTHKKCGSVFIRGYYKPGQDGFYLWGESGGVFLDEKLEPIDLLIDEPHREAFDKKRVVPLWIDITTGFVTKESPPEEALPNYQKIYSSPANYKKGNKAQTPYDASFKKCPCCLGRSEHGIMNLRTKGEQPFANLIREQFNLQPPVPGKDHPNEGRKVLLFSDGRQKAARLARDIPNEVEKDTLRELLLQAAFATNSEYSLEKMYPALIHFIKLHNVSLFDKTDRSELQQDIEIYVEEFLLNAPVHETDLREVLEDTEEELEMRSMIRKKIAEVLAAPGISLYDTTTGFVVPVSKEMKKICRELQLPEDYIKVIAVMFIKYMLDDLAFDGHLLPRDRREIFGYYRSNDEWGKELHKISDSLENLIVFLCGESKKDQVVEQLYKKLCRQHGLKHFLVPGKLTIANGIDHTWHKCNTCKQIHAFKAKGYCPNCLSANLEELPPDSPMLASEKGYWRTPVKQVLYEKARIRNMTVEEHTAQLSQKDEGTLFATTEHYELAFQDIPIPNGGTSGVVDILSCTTTMEVGIDIGSLTAVGMRNIPPQRENYQQRAGRAGRRGTSLSTVVIYAQDGPHDHHYFHHPEAIISGPPSESVIYIENEKIIRRHLIAILIQTYFHEHVTENVSPGSKINEALGCTIDFFMGDPPFNLESFEAWLQEVSFETHRHLFNFDAESVLQLGELADKVIELLPRELWHAFEKIRHEVEIREEDDREPQDIEQGGNYYLLEFLFNHGFLPTYAFPRDLVSLYIQARENGNVYVKQRPQLELNRALSEYSPGRQVVVDKETYRIGGIYSPYAPDPTKPAAHYSFQNKVAYCDRCKYTRLGENDNENCPTCNSTLKTMPYIRPMGFSPEKGISVERWDDEQEISYASMPLFPLPNQREELGEFAQLGKAGGIHYVYTSNKELIVLNRGIDDESGFEMCEECGFIRPVNQKVRKSATPHDKPFLGVGNSQCTGRTHYVFLGNQFVTDLLLIRLHLNDRLNFNPQGNNSWLYAALDTLGEAIVLAASRVLDIDVQELVTGYRIITENGGHYADLYVFDSLSGGAGYSYAAGKRIEEIISETHRILRYCEGNCSSSCYKCLRHYKNQLKHHTLNRYLALELLEYLKDGTLRRYSMEEQKEYVKPLVRMCEILNYRLEEKSIDGQIVLETENGKRVLLRNNIEKPPAAQNGVIYFSPSEIAFDLEKAALLVVKG
jgi:hypothetical protein